MIKIELAIADEEISRCYAVMAQLRPHLTPEDFLQRVKMQQQEEGYKLAYLEDKNEVKSLAGYRFFNMLAYGKFLYVDDLVTDENARSKGYGDMIFDWLVERAKEENCDSFQLDSGVQRFAAHRFYMRKRMIINTHHFYLGL